VTTLLSVRPAADGPSWAVDAVPYAYDEAGKVQFQAMPGVQWVRDRDTPNGRGFYRGPVEAIRLVVATLESAGVAKVRWELPANDPPAPSPYPTGYPADFRDYQRDGVSWCRHMLATTGAALLCDEMGIGKTAQAIVALAAPGRMSSSTLVICPAVVRKHWANQIAKWSREPGRHFWHVVSPEGFQALLRKAAKDPELTAMLMSFEAVILDEIHYYSNPKAKRTAAVAGWLASRPEVLRLALSGTPMTARPKDLWQPLDLLWPGRFGRQWNFQQRYCNGRFEEIPNTEKSVWLADGASRIDELAIRLQAVMLRRLKSEVLRELPPKVRVVHEVEIPGKALRDLQRAAAAINWAGNAGHGVSSLLSNVEGYKITAACDLAREVVAAGGRALILTTRKATAATIGEALGAPVVDGDTDPQERQAQLADATIGVATMYSVTTGIDLTGYDHVIFTGLDWVPSTLLQAEDRIHRLGQDRPCTIYYLIGTGTLDEVVRERVIERLDTIAKTVGGSGETGLAADLGGGSEDDLIAAMIAAVQKAAA
jgi:hypothetical protein